MGMNHKIVATARHHGIPGEGGHAPLDGLEVVAKQLHLSARRRRRQIERHGVVSEILSHHITTWHFTSNHIQMHRLPTEERRTSLYILPSTSRRNWVRASSLEGLAGVGYV